MTSVLNTITAVTGQNQLTEEQRTYYSLKLLKRLLPKVHHYEYGAHDSIPKSGGTKINRRRFESLTTSQTPTSLTEGAANDALPVTITKVEITPDQYGDYIKTTDRALLQSMDALISEFTNLVREHAARTMDIIVRNPIVLGTTVLYGGLVAARTDLDDTSICTPADIKRAVTILDGNNCDDFTIGGSYVAIAHPFVINDITSSTDWKDLFSGKYTNPAPVLKNEIGMIYNCRFVKSTQTYKVAGGGDSSNVEDVQKTGSNADVYITLILSEEAYACVTMDNYNTPEILAHMPTQSVSDPLAQIALVAFKAWQGSGIVDQKKMVRLENTVSKISS